ncbi:hypothetical protein WQ54_26135 [Bacillus sp. SA1-12]|nr:hypothetical protein WQ54_26135 [Bacillus sp. SA1-12]
MYPGGATGLGYPEGAAEEAPPSPRLGGAPVAEINTKLNKSFILKTQALILLSITTIIKN